MKCHYYCMELATHSETAFLSRNRYEFIDLVTNSHSLKPFGLKSIHLVTEMFEV